MASPSLRCHDSKPEFPFPLPEVNNASYISLALVNNWHFFKWKFALYTSSAGFCHICIVVDLSYATGDNFL